MAATIASEQHKFDIKNCIKKQGKKSISIRDRWATWAIAGVSYLFLVSRIPQNFNNFNSEFSKMKCGFFECDFDYSIQYLSK